MKTIRLLYVEDDDEQRRKLAAQLRRKGFQLTVARSGKTGIKFFKQRKFDAVLCDLNMPGKSGEEVLDVVRKRDANIPFIILSAHGTVSQAVKTIKKGAHYFILKPASINEIAITLNQAIERRTLETELADSKAALQMVAENVPDIIYSLGPKGEFLNISAAVMASMGYRPQELVGTSVFDIIHPEDRPGILRDFASTIKSGGEEVRNLMFRMISKSGEVRHFEVSRRLIFEAGRLVRVDGIARDDTERIQLQSKLEEYSQRLEKMVEERTESLARANRQLSALNTASNKINKIFDEELLLDNVCALLTRTLDFDRSYLILERDSELYIRSRCPGDGAAAPPGDRAEKGEGASVQLPPHVRESFQKKRTVFVRDIKSDRRWPQEQRFMGQPKSVVFSPITVQRKVLGIIGGSMDDPRRDMTRHDVERFEMFANMVGLALDNIRAYQSMEQKVVERTQSLKSANQELETKAAELEDSRIQLAFANVELLAVQEDLQKKNRQMEGVLKELSKRSKELETVVDTGPNAILLVDSDGIVQVANRRIAEYFGIRQASLIGESYDNFCRSKAHFFEDPENFLRLMDALKVKPDVSDQLDMDEFYDRELTLKGDVPIVLAPISLSVLDENKGEIGRVWVFLNITRAIQAHQQIHAIVEASPIPTIISRIDTGEILFANEQLAALIGSSAGDLLGRSAREFYHRPKDRDRMLEILRREGSVNDFEVEIRRVDGSVIWAMISIAITEISAEKVILGALYNISERKQFEEALANRLRYEKGLAALSQTLLTGTDRENALPEALDHLLQAAAASRVYIFENFESETDGLCSRQIYEVCAPGVEAQIDNPDLQHIPYSAAPERWGKMFSNGEPLKGLVRNFSDPEKAILEPQGILSMVCIPFRVEGRWYGFVGFDETKCEREWSDDDIRTLQTAAEIIGIYFEKQKFEESLRISEERFRSLVENANDIIYSMAPNGTFTYISPKSLEQMGYEPDELVGKPFFPLLHPDDLNETLEWFQSGFARHEDHAAGYEFRLIHKNGSIRWITTNASQILDENGKVMELIGVAHDITQMKMVLEEIERANKHLKETQAQLAQADKMASLGMLVAGIAHEINTPMGAVNSMHDTLVHAVAKLKDTIQNALDRELLEETSIKATLDIIDDSNSIIKSGAERVTTIVRRLRSFARLDEAELKTADIHEGLEDTLVLIYHDIKHDIAVNRNYGDVPPLACFPGQLNQVFLNMLVNARQAIRGKGQITITTYAEGNKAFIRIADTGVGIPSGNLSRIFDPGFTTKGVGVGTGLGLAICYKIVLDHMGEIKVESEVGQGTTFTIILPMHLDKLVEKRA